MTSTKQQLRKMGLQPGPLFEQLERKLDQAFFRLGSMIVVATGILIAIKYFG